MSRSFQTSNPFDLGHIYAITPDTEINLKHTRTLLSTYNISILQYRRKNTPSNIQIKEASHLLALCHEYDTRCIINDNIELARSIGADGVHLGQNDDVVSTARKHLGDNAIIGVSCYNSTRLALHAEEDGADYIGVGALYPSLTKPHATHCSLQQLQTIKNTVSLPIAAIGGITFENAHEPLAHGADMVAMIHELWSKVC